MASPQRRRRRWPAWSLAWQTDPMPVPAFWYFRTRRAARQAASQFRPEVSWRISKSVCLRPPPWAD